MRIVGLLLLILYAQSPVVGQVSSVLYVNGRAGGAQTGASWSDALLSLQDALAIVRPDDQIWVATGTYRPDENQGHASGDSSAVFRIPPRVALFGGFLGTEALPDQRPAGSRTEISGDLLENDALGRPPVPGSEETADNSLHLVRLDGAGVVIDGFRLKGALVHTVFANGQCEIRDTDFVENLGWAEVSGCLFVDVRVERNRTVKSALTLSGPSVIRGSWFEDNETFSWWAGGAVVAMPGRNNTLTVDTSTFLRNRAIFGGGLMGWARWFSYRIAFCRTRQPAEVVVWPGIGLRESRSSTDSLCRTRPRKYATSRAQ